MSRFPKRLIPRYLVQLGLALLLSAVATPTLSQTDYGHARGIYSQVQEPQNLTDLMQNIRLAVSDGFLLRRDFYSEQNLERFFGGDEVQWSKSNIEPNRIWGYVKGFARIVEPQPLSDGRSMDSLTLEFRLSIESGPKTRASLWIHFATASDSRPYFSKIQEIFGDAWVHEEMPLSAHRPFRTPTASLGNKRILYKLSTHGRRIEMRFDFAFDGHLEVASIWMETVGQ